MNTAPLASVLDFEVYLLATMKYGMLNREAEREAKLAEHGLTFGDADGIHQRVADLLHNESTQFENLRVLVGEPEAASLTFEGILWPEFDFAAVADRDGSIRSAEYRRVRGEKQVAAAPTDQPPWSMDVADFAQSFGPVTVASKSPLFAEFLPAQELHEFGWGERRYGAGFAWGLFLSASLMWT